MSTNNVETGKATKPQSLAIPYVLKKSGMYYAHNSCGYVSRVLLAELYDKDYAINYAKNCDEVHAIPITELLTGVDEVQKYIDRIEIMKETMANFEQDNLLPKPKD